MAGPASLPDTGPCGAHGASDDDLEVPHRAPSKSLAITSCKKMPDPLFCPLQDRGEKPGHVISGWCRKLRKNKRMQRWLHRQVCRAPAHVELTVPLLDDWSTSGGSSSHSALSSQDVSAVISIWYRPMWSSRYLWGISYVPCGDTSKLELHCQDPFRPLLFYCQLQHNKPREFSEIHDQPQRVKQV